MQALFLCPVVLLIAVLRGFFVPDNKFNVNYQNNKFEPYGEGGRLENSMYLEAIRKDIIQRNKGKTLIEARYIPKYPDSAEREYFRMVNKYMEIEKDILIKYIPEIKRILSQGTVSYNMDAKNDNDRRREEQRRENIDTTLLTLGDLFRRMQWEMNNAFGLFHLRKELESIANLNHKMTVKEWKKVIGKTLGVNILEDYYSGSFYKEMLEKWVSKNVDLIKTVPKESLGKIKHLVYQNFMDGRTNTDIIKELQDQYGVDKRHARLIARDQTGKLNAQITEHQQRDAGIMEYMWRDSRDGRVRDKHRKLHGHVFSWDHPPDVGNRRHCHPGQDYQCRCRAAPIFDVSKLDIPVIDGITITGR